MSDSVMKVLRLTVREGLAFSSTEHSIDDLVALWRRWVERHPEDLPKEPGYPLIEMLEMTEAEYISIGATTISHEFFTGDRDGG